MVDGNTMTFAETQGAGIETQYLDNNTLDIVPLLDRQGVILNIEIRAYAITGDSVNSLSFVPYFDGTSGQTYLLNTSDSTAGFTSWVDITNDSNAPNFWTWYDTTSIDVLITANVNDSTTEVAVSIVQIQVRYVYGSSSSSSSSLSSSSVSSSSSGALYRCPVEDDCVDAWDLSFWYGCNESPNIVTNMCEVDIGDCVEFNQGSERIWGIVIDERSCSFIVRVISDLVHQHPFKKYDRVELELKNIYNVDSSCSNF